MVRCRAHRIWELTGASADSARHSLRLKDRFALTHRLFFSGRKLGLYQHSTTAQRLIFEHVSICSPSQFARLNENHINYWRAVLPPSTAGGRFFFGPELDRWGQISCSFFYLPPSIGLLLTVWTNFLCTRDHIWKGIFAAEYQLTRAILERHHAPAASELAGWRSSLPFF